MTVNEKCLLASYEVSYCIAKNKKPFTIGEDLVLPATIYDDSINECFNKGLYPKRLKISQVIPIYKNGDPKQVSNNSSKSILSQFDKIIEKLIYNCISSFIEKNNLLCENQFGFRKHSSTIFAINSIFDKFYLMSIKIYLHAVCFWICRDFRYC